MDSLALPGSFIPSKHKVVLLSWAVLSSVMRFGASIVAQLLLEELQTFS